MKQNKGYKFGSKLVTPSKKYDEVPGPGQYAVQSTLSKKGVKITSSGFKSTEIDITPDKGNISRKGVNTMSIHSKNSAST